MVEGEGSTQDRARVSKQAGMGMINRDRALDMLIWAMPQPFFVNVEASEFLKQYFEV